MVAGTTREYLWAKAKKAPGIDEIVAALPSRVDTVSAPATSGKILSRAKELYALYLESWDESRGGRNYGDRDFIIKRLPVCTPAELSSLSNCLPELEFAENLGPLLSVLVQKSYDTRFNDFHLFFPIEYRSFNNLQGTPERPLKLHLLGDAGEWLALNSRYVDIDLEGNAGRHFANNAKYSRFMVQGDVFDDSVKGCEDSLFLIEGTAGRLFGDHSVNSDFLARKEIKKGAGYGSKNCLFVSPIIIRDWSYFAEGSRFISGQKAQSIFPELELYFKRGEFIPWDKILELAEAEP